MRMIRKPGIVMAAALFMILSLYPVAAVNASGIPFTKTVVMDPILNNTIVTVALTASPQASLEVTVDSQAAVQIANNTWRAVLAGSVNVTDADIQIAPVTGTGGGGAPTVFAPFVQTEFATTVTANSAALNGKIPSDNNSNITEYGFLWGTSDSSLTNTLKAGTDNHSGSFTAILGNLTAGTKYYFQAYAKNAGGTGDGAVMRFTTTGASWSTAPSKAPVFSDVATTSWAYAAINSLSSSGIVSGYPDNTFKPEATITRVEFVTMLVKVLGLDTTGATATFTDVAADSWYNGSVNAAVYSGLVSGMGDHLFTPNALITREQMAVMATKALGDKAPAVDGTELNAFSDRPAVSSWAAPGMEEAVMAGIVSGMTAGTLAPQADATRAQAAVMIQKMLTYYNSLFAT